MTACSEQLGGKPAPGVGFAMGCERLVALMKDSGKVPAAPRPDAYLVHQGEGAAAYAFALPPDALRTAGHCGGVARRAAGSFKSQMKKAERVAPRLALVVGEDELRAGEVSVKMLRKSFGATADGPRASAIERFNSFLQKAKE